MVAKFIAHGRDRDDAIRRLVAALEDVPLLGVRNNARFLRDLLRHPQFQQSTLTTTRLDEWMAAGEPLLQRPPVPEPLWRLAAALRAGSSAGRPASIGSTALALVCHGERRSQRTPIEGIELLGTADGPLRACIDGVWHRIRHHDDGITLRLAWDGAVYDFTEPSPYPEREDKADPRRARAPVAGVVGAVLVAPGDVVAAGQPLLCVEAMKMEMWLNAAAAGTVRAVHARSKEPVASGAVLVELEINE
jgi:geranyl-CoA carboxylase alpha subunit